MKKQVLFFLLFIGAAFSDIFETAIPLHIWQTYQTKKLPYFALEPQQTWISLNPKFSYHLWDDKDIEPYLLEKWGEEYFDFFKALPIGAMKADLWRYLILTTEGGIYSDIDSICLMPIKNWPFPEKKTAGPMLLVDLDEDESQFCQWTLACTPKHPAMQYVCYAILQNWKEKGLSYEEDGTIDVLNTTGPKFFSKALKKYLKVSSNTPAIKIKKAYETNPRYRRDLQLLGIFFTPKGFFKGEGAKNLFWGSTQSFKGEYSSWETQRKET